MRRSIANSLVLLLCCSLLAPLALAWQAQALPACCRRGGKHHCMAMAGVSVMADDAGPAIGSASEPCPFRSLKPSRVEAARLPEPAASLFALSGTTPLLFAARAVFPGCARLRRNAERGPPRLSLSTNS